MQSLIGTLIFPYYQPLNKNSGLSIDERCKRDEKMVARESELARYEKKA